MTTEAATTEAATTTATTETTATTTAATTETLVGKDVSTETATTTATTEQAADWRKSIADARAKGDEAAAAKILKKLERFNDPGALFESFEETQAALRDSGRIKLPGKDATPEDVAAFNKSLGIPEKADDYKIKLPDGIALDDGDKAQLKAITEYLHKQGGMAGSPETVQHAANLFMELREQAQAQLIAEAATFARNSEAELRKEWGAADFAKNIALTGPGVVALVGRDGAEELRTLRLANGALLGDHPLYVKLGASAGRLSQQDPVFWAANQMQGDGKSLEGRKSEIMKLRTSSVPGDREKYAEASKPGGELAIINERLAQVRSNNGRAA